MLGAGKQEVAAKTTTPAAKEPAQTNTVAPTDVGNSDVGTAADKTKKKRGYQATRVEASRNVLTDTVSGEKKTTLG